MPTALAGMVPRFKLFDHQSFMPRISAFFKRAGYLLSCRHNSITKVDYGLFESDLCQQFLALCKRPVNERLPIKIHDIIGDIYKWDLAHHIVCNSLSPEPLLQLLKMQWSTVSVGKHFAIQNEFRREQSNSRCDLWKRARNIF